MDLRPSPAREETNLLHLCTGLFMRAPRQLLINLLPRDVRDQSHKLRTHDFRFTILEWQCDFADPRNESDNLDAKDLLEVLFGNSTSCHPANRLPR